MNTAPFRSDENDQPQDARRLPPLEASRQAAPHDEALQQERAERDARARGVVSMQAMRDAIRESARALPLLDKVPRIKRPDAAAFRARAEQGLPFLVEGVASRWPLAALPPSVLRERYGHVPVRARVGDYIGTAFAPDRAMRDMAMRDYLDLAEQGGHALPPYVGNLELRELNALCHWPGWFEKMGPPRFWVGPAGTVTPLHCDYDDNIFAQVWGSKRIFLAPPHHDAFLYVKPANPVLFGSPFDPEHPDFERYPLARQARLVDVVVRPGEMLYVPAGWYHQVRALSFSLSSNRWARAMPLALRDDPALKRD
ncbi:cupin-like domain-containing protein [Massilia sp. YIM B02763]|uniref:cupin-like domain-containing protein n=1 Tax=Massilia sp. YIM B02763 TaxID=3050130 RepID=UPI0025B72595|nr:cupin-like domain-containing protein [Massilia sp. YIM B02763]MDN4055918.1 cupin-like domain-containing protein [Massilia sp. YIM B02763]